LRRDLHILLIDDNPDHIKILIWALEQSEIKNKVSVIEDGKKALDVLESLDSPESVLTRKPDIIFLDMNLPPLNGLDLLRRIKSDPALCLIPVIIISSSDRIEDVKKAYEYGANTYISKSKIFDEVALAVNTICHYWVNVAQLSTRQ
jgi:two-component system, response regulator